MTEERVRALLEHQRWKVDTLTEKLDALLVQSENMYDALIDQAGETGDSGAALARWRAALEAMVDAKRAL